jgi:hypothetical protein
MNKEVFLVKGIIPKKTGKLLKFLSENNYKKIQYLKRVKSKGPGENLVIIEQIPEDFLENFLKKFDNKSQSIVDLVQIEKSFFQSEIESNLKNCSILDKFSLILTNLEEKENLYLLKISRSQKNLVINN